jgi:hypothetical protein
MLQFRCRCALMKSVDVADRDLSPLEVLERGHSQLPHIAFVEGPRRRSQPVLRIEVLEQHIDAMPNDESGRNSPFP